MQDAAPGCAACGWCYVCPASTKVGSVPPTARMTLLQGWHVVASIPWAGWGSACAEHHDAAPSSWQDGCQPMTAAGWAVEHGWLRDFLWRITEFRQ